MNSTLDLIYVRSVLPTFSWDDGNFEVDSASIPSTQTLDGKDLYVGYAPITQILANSDPYDYNPDSAYLVRAADFGDYYNSSTNVLNISGIAGVKFRHAYAMPGLYSINVSNAEYAFVDSLTWNEVTVASNPALVWTAYTGISSTTLNGQTIVPNVTALITNSTASFMISVVEIMPTAYLSSSISFNPDDIIFPLTVTITPRYTQTGSFPIEKIVWDLGDGSPLITKTRWDGNTSLPFVSSGALSADLLDPRNFDIVHTYNKPNNSVFSFYPSITAYTYSTGSSDTCSITVGPVQSHLMSPALTDEDKFNLLQTELNEDGSVIVGQIGSDIGIWKTL